MSKRNDYVMKKAIKCVAFVIVAVVCLTLGIIAGRIAGQKNVKQNTATPEVIALPLESQVPTEALSADTALPSESATQAAPTPGITVIQDNPVSAEPTTDADLEAPTPSSDSSGVVMDWKKIYDTYVTNLSDKSCYIGYRLIYLNDDDIPELVMLGDCEATGCVIVTAYDSYTTEYNVNLNFSYIERQNLLLYSWGRDGDYHEDIIGIKDGTLIKLDSASFDTSLASPAFEGFNYMSESTLLGQLRK